MRQDLRVGERRTEAALRKRLAKQGIKTAGATIGNHGVLSGRDDDGHLGYPWWAGREGGQSIAGGKNSGESLIVRGTSHGDNNGPIILNPDGGFIGINMDAPARSLDMISDTGIRITAATQTSPGALLELRTVNPVGVDSPLAINQTEVRCYDNTAMSFRAGAFPGNVSTKRYCGLLGGSDRDGTRLPVVIFTRDVADSGYTSFAWCSFYAGAGQPAGTAGPIGIGGLFSPTLPPTARLHLAAGTTAAGTAPFKLTSGPLNTIPEPGAAEFLTNAFYGTITTGAARKTFAFLESPIFTGNVGIGITPIHKLHLSGSGIIVMGIFSTDTGRAMIRYNRNAGLDWDTGINADALGTNDFKIRESTNVRFMLQAATGNIGFNTSTFDASAAKVLAIANGTAPAAHTDNQIYIYSADSSDATSTLALYLEQAVEAIGTFTPSHKIKIILNGTAYAIQLNAV